ncbi:MAG TPA: hypothetical protein VNJ01_10075 [Bacteriovoracaceae bacterium]|nr:hypothetical protein [Bacteriovoracaceae bacterium]
MNLSRRTGNILATLVVFFACWGYFYSLPWHSPLEIDVSEVKGTTFQLTYQRPDGQVLTKKFFRSELPSPNLSLLSLYPLAFETDSTEPSVLNVKLDKTETKIPFVKAILSFAPRRTSRESSEVLRAVTVSSLTLAIIAYFFFVTFLQLKAQIKDPRYLITLATHVVLLGSFFFFFFPGIIDYDGFNNLEISAEYRYSSFVGKFFNTLLITSYQLFPHAWVIPVATLLGVITSLMILYTQSRTIGAEKCYFAACLLFYCYPINLYMAISSGRDTVSHWLITIIALKFYEKKLTEDWNRTSIFKMCFAIVVVCLLRQENKYFVPFFALAYAYFFNKKLLKPFLITTVTIFTLLSSPFFFKDTEPGLSFYRTSVLVNPLSYILKEKYGKSLPPEVNIRLGDHFKNQMLLDHHSDYDIDAFHRGGIRHPVSVENFQHFLKTSLKIISENPLLFLKNRIIITSYMFGLRKEFSYAVGDEYFLSLDYLTKVKASLGFPDYQRPDNGPLKSLLPFIYRTHPIYFRSYLIPLALLLWFLLKRRPVFKFICLIFVARTLLICLTAPAGFFKYNYALWIFVVFALPLLWREGKIQPLEMTKY